MATRKPTYIGEVGPTEMAVTDDIALGGLAMGGNITMDSNKITGLGAASAAGDAIVYGQASASLAGLALTDDLAMGTHEITGMAAGTSADSGVNKSQLDSAVIQGGQVKEQLLHEDQVDNAEGILASVALTMINQPAAGDTISITDGTTTRTYGATSGGDVQYTIGAGVADTMANLAAAIEGDGSAAWGASFSTDLSSIDSDGVVVITEDDNDGTASEIYGTWATPANAQIVDFGGEDDYNNSTLTQLPTSDPASTNFGFNRTQASLSPGEIHNVRDNDTLYSWDDDTDTWQVMSGGSSIPDATAASGGGIKGKVTFDSDYGLSVTAGIARIALATDPGLEFSSGDLQAKPNTAAGVEVTSSGIGIDIAATNPGVGFDGSGDLEAKLSGSTLDKDASGLKVLGLPSLFTVNGVAVGATVTAANLDTLTDTSNADALHTHSSQPASRLVAEITAEENLSHADPVEWGTTNDEVRQCRASVTARVDCFAVVEEVGGILADGTGTIVRRGPATILTGATVGTRYYVADAGGLVTSLGSISAGSHIIFVGTAINATQLEVNPQYIGQKAA